MSARDVIEHALRVYYADVRDPKATVGKLLARYDADHRAEVLNEAAVEMDAHCEQYGVFGVGDRLRRMADQTPTATAPDTGADDARPPRHCWYTVLLDNPPAGWLPGKRFTARSEAIAHYDTESAQAPRWDDGTPVHRQLVRETTTYAVELTREGNGTPRAPGPAPEEEPVLTVGAVAEDGRPVALLFDPDDRRKVAGWLAPADAAELERLRVFAASTERRHNEIRALLARVDIRDSAEAWDLGMAIIATLDGPLHPEDGAAPPIAVRFRALLYDVLARAADTDALPALKLAQVRQYLAEVIARGLLERDGTASDSPARATRDPEGDAT